MEIKANGTREANTAGGPMPGCSQETVREQRPQAFCSENSVSHHQDSILPKGERREGERGAEVRGYLYLRNAQVRI